MVDYYDINGMYIEKENYPPVLRGSTVDIYTIITAVIQAASAG